MREWVMPTALFSLLCSLQMSGGLDTVVMCSRSALTAVQVNGSRGGNAIHSGEGVVARGCFAPSANSSVGNVTVRISQNYTSLVETLLDTQTVCFELHFILEETGNLTLTLTAVEVAADSNANTLCNGSLPVTVEVLPCTLRSLPVTPRLLYLSDVSHGLCLEDAWIGTVLQGSLGGGMIVDRPGLGGALLTIFNEVTFSKNSSETTSEWRFQDDSCWLQLQGRQGFENAAHELDFGDHLELELQMLLTELGETMVGDSLRFLPEHMWDISVQFSNPDLFDYDTALTHLWSQTSLTLNIWQRAPTTAQSVVQFHCAYCPQRCMDCTLEVTISSGQCMACPEGQCVLFDVRRILLSAGCPVGKHLRFSYPEPKHHFKLPVNYRPPSWLGTAIPTSPHIYNADPSYPLMNTHYDISKATATLKQCRWKTDRSECNCSMDLETSTDVAFSDCITRVYRHPFDSPLPLRFTIELGGGVQAPVVHPILLEELNNRSDLTIKGLVDDRVIDPTGNHREMVFHGPGLYHFNATVQSNSSFCRLTTQIIVYVDRVPLMRATEYSLATCTVVLFGILTFAVNLYYHRHHHHRC